MSFETDPEFRNGLYTASTESVTLYSTTLGFIVAFYHYTEQLLTGVVSGPLPKTLRTLRWTLTWMSGAPRISPSQFHTLVLGGFFLPSSGSTVKL